MFGIIIALFLIGATYIYLMFSGALDFDNPDKMERSYQVNRRTQGRKNKDILKALTMLLLANIVMAAAWYAHLRFAALPISIAILISWVLALPEYWLHVPANRKGHAYLTAVQLRVIQTIFTIAGFIIFTTVFFAQDMTLKDLISYLCLLVGAYLVFSPPIKLNFKFGRGHK